MSHYNYYCIRPLDVFVLDKVVCILSAAYPKWLKVEAPFFFSATTHCMIQLPPSFSCCIIGKAIYDNIAA